MPGTPTIFSTLQAAYNSTWLNPHASAGAYIKKEGEEATREEAPPEAELLANITPPPPPAAYVCNPAHVFVRATMEAANPVIFDKFYYANLDHLEYAIDATGRSYLVIFVNVENQA